MKISYNWLKDYLNVDLEPKVVSEILTDIGLEVEGIESIQSIKGGLEGVVIGQVKEVNQHPNADRLKLTKVDVGHADLLDIVCGAPNVAEGQKVVVALVGATIYPDEKGLKIKKSKIRGEVSEGMLCAEDELGLGVSHDGIMVLENDAKIGIQAAKYFKLEEDTVFEIGLTPNRVDATSHYGVARDLAAYLNIEDQVELKFPSLKDYNEIVDANSTIKIVVEDVQECPRYAGVELKNVKVEESPKWLKTRLSAIGLKPINNVVDITNYVLHELGQPLHAFDLDKIVGNKVIVKKVNKGLKFTTLDEVERELSSSDLMICNAKEPMCIAGVFGGEDSGVNENTNSIFLESAYFDPTSVRKTAKYHGLNTDASFRFERGVDPNMTIKALKRASILIQKVCGATQESAIQDFYPNEIEDFIIDLDYSNVDRILGQKIERSLIKKILSNLEIELLNETKSTLRLKVPAYRVDVQREIDLIEEILRLYGFNRILIPEQAKTSLISSKLKTPNKLENLVANLLSSRGYFEILNNSLTKAENALDESSMVTLENPLSQELAIMRQSLLFNGLASLEYNLKRKRSSLKLFEFGKTYSKSGNEKYKEIFFLGIWLTGDKLPENWNEPSKEVTFFDLKETVYTILQRLGFSNVSEEQIEVDHSYFSDSLKVTRGNVDLVSIGELRKDVLAKWDIKQKVYYADINWSNCLKAIKQDDVKYKAVSKFPEVRRDLALLIDRDIQFSQIESIAKQTEKNILKEVSLFDVYEGKNLQENKKSYGVSLVFQDQNKTLTDKHIDNVMDRLVIKLKEELKAELR